jgi:hypothetical protein
MNNFGGSLFIATKTDNIPTYSKERLHIETDHHTNHHHTEPDHTNHRRHTEPPT